MYSEGMAACAIPLPHSLLDSHNFQSLRREAFKRRDDFEIVNQCPLAERYANGRLSVALDVTTFGNLQLISKTGIDSGFVGEAIDRPIFILQFHAINLGDAHDWEQEVVFVVNVETVNGPDVAIPSLVGSIASPINSATSGRIILSLRK